MNIEVVKFDNLGRGIGYYNNKIIFIPKSVPGDIVKIEIVNEKKNYMEGKIIEVIQESKLRKKVVCPFFYECGGCDLLHISLSDALEYKIQRINDLLKNNKINYNVNKIIKSKERFNYRNKITLKIVNKVIGFYEIKTHKIVAINYCFLCNDAINNLIRDLSNLNINNGEVTIRSNYNNELLLIIKSEDHINNIEEIINNHKIVGIIQNDKCIYGEDYFIEKIDNYLFKVSYDAFFQINPYICNELFKLIKEHTNNSKNLLDLYCGVGSLGIVASKNCQKVMGIEIIENAIKNANLNKNFNKALNCEFICSDTKSILNKITKEYDTIILDPPRSGVIKEIIDTIKQNNIPNIIYVSCDPNTLVRDLNYLLTNYQIKEFILLDMFPNTEHVESFVILENVI